MRTLRSTSCHRGTTSWPRPAARLLPAVLVLAVSAACSRRPWVLAVSAACASTQGRLEQGLLQAGVPPVRSECMARHLSGKLSRAQVRRLSSAQRPSAAQGGAPGVERFLVNAQAIGDPRITTVTSAVALGCAMVEP